MTKADVMNALAENMASQDSDLRFMGLSDLMRELEEDLSSFLGDEAIEMKIIEQVLVLLADKMSEIKDLAVKCFGQLAKIIREPQMQFVIDKLVESCAGLDDGLRDTSALALAAIASELPQDGHIAEIVSGKLASRLLKLISKPSTPVETVIEALSILSILASRFSHHLQTYYEGPEPLGILWPILDYPRLVVRRRAITTLAQFIPFSLQDFATLFRNEVHPNLKSNHLRKQRTGVQLIAAVARHSAVHILPVIPEVVPTLLAAAQNNDDELREDILQTLETLLLCCSTQITPFVPQIIQVGTEYINATSGTIVFGTVYRKRRKGNNGF